MSTFRRRRSAESIDRLSTSDGDEPSRWILRNSALLPRRCSTHQRVLQRVLSKVEVAQQPDQARQYSGAVLAVDEIEGLVHRHRLVILVSDCRVYISATGRTSTDPNFADGTIAAAAKAWSSSSHSIR